MQVRSLAVLALVAVTAIWGSTFFMIKGAIAHIDPVDFLAVRFAMATAVLLLLFGARVVRAGRRRILIGVGIGMVYGLAQILQTVGLASTDASISGFLTSAYVVLTPFLALAVLRTRISRRDLLASVAAMVGIAILSITGFGIGGGEGLTLISAIVYALHIVLVGVFARDVGAIELATLQMVGITLFVGAFALPGGIFVPSRPIVWGAILYTALLASIVVLFLQSWAQQHLTASTTAIIMALEPLFASAFAFAFGGESLTLRLVLGGSLILAAILMATVGVPDGNETKPAGEVDETSPLPASTSTTA